MSTAAGDEQLAGEEYSTIPLDAPAEIYRAAFDAVTSRLDTQFASIDELRSRALGTMGSIGTLLGVLSALGASRPDRWMVVLALVASGLAVVLLAGVLWPINKLGQEPRDSLDNLKTYAHNGDDAVNYFYVYSCRDKETLWRDNELKMGRRLSVYSCGLTVALAAVVLWGIAIGLK